MVRVNKEGPMLNKININPNKQRLIVYIVLTVVTLAVFWQVSKFDFINFDDNLYVSENNIVQSGLTPQGFLWAFSTRYFNLWTPLVWLSFMLDSQFYGLNAGGYHLTNVILHILSALLLFWLFNRMTGAIWKSAFIAAFFALHPLHVESVAWIAERKDVLSAFFWMLTLCLYVYYTEKPVAKRYLLVLFGFILAILSKPMVITLPFIMILLDYWPLQRFKSKQGNLLLWQLKEKFLFFALSIILIIVTLYEQGEATKGFPFYSRLANAPVAFMNYLIKTFWPSDLTIFYPFVEHLPLWQVLGAILLIIIITATVLVTAKRLPYLFVGWLWLAITIAPVMGIIDNGATFSMTDRYHYLPSIGIVIMLAWSVPLLFKDTETLKKILFPASIVFLTLMAFISWRQCGYWRNNSDLWNHALSVTKDNYMAHNNLASVQLEKGNVNKAIYHYKKAISINNYSAAHYNMGIIYYRLGEYKQSIESFNQAIHKTPDYAAAYFNLGIVYFSVGQVQHALESYNEAIRIKPDYVNAYNNRAFLYLYQGQKVSGCTNALKACKLGNCQALKWANGKGLCN
jgi:protein O-mannosyl-transferase